MNQSDPGVRVDSSTMARTSMSSDALRLGEDELYQEHILEHFECPYHRGPCPFATHAHEDDNPLCGDFVHIDLAIDEQGTIRDAWFSGDGCCISQASASMLIEKVQGSTVDDVKKFSAENMLQLLGARLTPNRQKCCLLSWKVLQAAVFSPLAADATADCAPVDARAVEQRSP